MDAMAADTSDIKATIGIEYTIRKAVTSAPYATIASFVIPSGLKPYLLRPELGPALAACAGALPYVALYVFLGWQVFRTRDA